MQKVQQSRIEQWHDSRLVFGHHVVGKKTSSNGTILQAAPTNEQNLRVYVAVSGDEIIGFISMVKLAEPKLDKDGEINAIYIRPQWQRCGIGKRT